MKGARGENAAGDEHGTIEDMEQDVVVMVTGHRHVTHTDLVTRRLAAVTAKLGTTVAISGGAEGADTLYARVAIDAGVALHLLLPNRHYRSKYPEAVSDDVVASASRVEFVVDRPDAVDWDRRWSAERWWVDNLVRNAAMIDRSDITIVVSSHHPATLAAEAKGGTAACVKELKRRRGGDHRLVWIPDSPATDVMWCTLGT